MKQIILGTAGHIDHGKTSLIKAITGIDTDRLKEEKLRGITIELGFASLDLPSGQHLGIVDVPGHEKFVKNMVAGATGIDIVVMVIAADEGVMPQTREHMEICTLLGVKHGMVVLSKIDMVDEEWLELALEDVRDFTRGTFLDEAPIAPVSSTTAKGIEEFIKALDELCAQVPERPPSTLFRLPVDRVFTMKGFGTVITGTLISGKVRVGDEIKIYPPLPSLASRIAMAGANFYDHSAKAYTMIRGVEVTKEEIRKQVKEGVSPPWGFWKHARNVIGPEEPIVYPKRTDRLDYELEVAAVFGKMGKDISEEEAMEYIYGYTIVNDVSCRDQPVDRGLFLAKNFDTSVPLGPFLVTADEIGDPHKLKMKLKINGEIRRIHSDSCSRKLRTRKLPTSLPVVP